MEDNILSINNLSCSYNLNETDKVLFISKLNIERGKIIFLLGSSGSGKSTLLETIGLMNNTIASGEVLFIDSNDKYHYSELWKDKTGTKISELRKSFLSFIFQNTNLMENFTAYENICLSQMIKSDAEQSQAMKGAELLMQQVGLPLSKVDHDTLSVNLSGGQRQRVSFVRALNTEYKILLCDEPTGNLDEINAHELIKIVKQDLSTDKTAIIVSHDVNLALKHADKIIVITKNKTGNYGEVLPENMFSKEIWESKKGDELEKFRNKLVDFFTTEASTDHKVDDKIHQWKEKKVSYKDLFIEKEGKALYGKSIVNLIILISIISLTLLAIGFANGTLKYLNQKLNDTFVNYLAVEIPFSKNTPLEVKGFLQNLNSSEVRSNFAIDTVTTYKVVQLPFYMANNFESEYLQGRLITYEDPLTSILFSKENKVCGDDNFENERDLGIVVTSKFLKKLGYKSDARVIYLDNGEIDQNNKRKINIKVPIPIRAIVKEIPGKNNFLISEYFLKCYKVIDHCVFSLAASQRKRIIFYFDGSNIEAKEFEKSLKSLLGNLNIKETKSMNSNNLKDSIENKLENESHNLAVDFSKDTCTYFPNGGYEIAVNFNDEPYDYKTTLNVLDKITYIEIDTGAVKEKKNFSYISKMTLLISILLVLFAILAISLFISNLLKTHLNKVKTNLGTYKAFGLSDKESQSIYMRIMLKFIAIGMVVSIAVAFILGKIIEVGVDSWLNIDDQSDYFILFDSQTYVLLITIISVTVVVSRFNIKKILSKTPGDLIYNR